jgi:hypothetical protein
MSAKSEEPYMAAAFRENFPTSPVPEILAQPCCSQFAVSRGAILSVSRAEYQAKIDWLINTPLSDQLTGRMWEHMWQFLFLGKAVDCPEEQKALCQGWGICFDSQEELEDWKRLALERELLSNNLEKARQLKEQLEWLNKKVSRMKNIAIQRGRDEEEDRLILEDN